MPKRGDGERIFPSGGAPSALVGDQAVVFVDAERGIRLIRRPSDDLRLLAFLCAVEAGRRLGVDPGLGPQGNAVSAGGNDFRLDVFGVPTGGKGKETKGEDESMAKAQLHD